jgi:hypothetical protein
MMAKGGEARAASTSIAAGAEAAAGTGGRASGDDVMAQLVGLGLIAI